MHNVLPSIPNIRPPGADKWYNPGRDINFLLPSVTRAVLQLIEQHGTPYDYVLDKFDCNDVDIGEVAIALAAFYSEDVVLHTDTVYDAFATAGLDDTQLAARLVVFAVIGEWILATYWYGQREFTAADGSNFDKLESQELADLAGELRDYLKLPMWRRKLYRWSKKVRNWLRERL